MHFILCTCIYLCVGSAYMKKEMKQNKHIITAHKLLTSSHFCVHKHIHTCRYIKRKFFVIARKAEWERKSTVLNTYFSPFSLSHFKNPIPLQTYPQNRIATLIWRFAQAENLVLQIYLYTYIITTCFFRVD